MYGEDGAANPFMYIGIDYYEEDGTLTDYLVSAGDSLTAFVYLKSNLYHSTSEIELTYDKNFFDLFDGTDGDTGMAPVVGDVALGAAYADTGAYFVLNQSHLLLIKRK